MNQETYYERTKSDYKNLEQYLMKNELIDDRRIWFAGFDNYRKATNNAIAGNLLYGNSKLIIVTINKEDICYLRNTKSGFKLSIIGHLGEKNKSTSLGLMHPAVDINTAAGEYFSIKVTKNKGKIKEFKQSLKK